MPVLPEGLITISSGVHGDIKRTDNEALDPAQIAEYWKGFTTLKRRLHNPRSERLESLFWRIWGSQKRPLKASVVATLLAEIMDGVTFVPLLGPPTDERPMNRPAASTTALDPNSRPSTTSSSASRPPMPHPILKKTRGPSTTGPRPTARFISPHDSEDDPSCIESPNTHVVVQPPSPSTGSQESKTEKKAKKKGFVASTGKKRRPVLGRRQSPQSSTEKQEIPSSVETPPQKSRFQENFSPSTKSPKKRSSLRTADAKRSPKVTEEVIAAGDPGPSNLRPVENNQDLKPTAEEIEEQRVLLAEAKEDMQKQEEKPSRQLHSSLRSKSEGKLTSKSKAPSTVGLAPSLAQLDDPTTPRTSVSSANLSLDKGKGRETASMFAKRTVMPVAPVVGTPEDSGLSRSKSQLTLLLERDRVRSGEKKGNK